MSERPRRRTVRGVRANSIINSEPSGGVICMLINAKVANSSVCEKLSRQYGHRSSVLFAAALIKPRFLRAFLNDDASRNYGPRENVPGRGVATPGKNTCREIFVS